MHEGPGEHYLPMTNNPLTRRVFLAAAAAVGTAGCLGESQQGDDSTDTPGDGADADTPNTATEQPTDLSTDTVTETEDSYKTTGTETSTDLTTQGDAQSSSFKASSHDISEYLEIEPLDWNGVEATAKEPSRYGDVVVSSFKYDQSVKNATINMDSGKPQLFTPGYDTDKQLPIVFNQQMLDEEIDIRFPTNGYIKYLSKVFDDEDKELGGYTGERLSYNEPLPDVFYTEHDTGVYAGVIDLTQFPPTDDLIKLNVFIGNDEYQTLLGGNIIDYRETR